MAITSGFRGLGRVAFQRGAPGIAYESVAPSLSYCVPCCTCAAWPSSAACGPADARTRVGGRALGLVLCGSLSCSLLPGLTGQRHRSSLLARPGPRLARSLKRERRPVDLRRHRRYLPVLLREPGASAAEPHSAASTGTPLGAGPRAPGGLPGATRRQTASGSRMALASAAPASTAPVPPRTSSASPPRDTPRRGRRTDPLPPRCTGRWG
jgi:hypothetical protein